jgi:hypothetical protein
MRYVALLIVFVASVLLLASWVVAGYDRPLSGAELARQDAEVARYQAEIDRLDRERERAELLAPLDVALAAGWRLLPLVAAGAALALFVALGASYAVRGVLERRPDERGLLPVPVADLGDLAAGALQGYHAARVAEASRAVVAPHTITYAPHLTGAALAAPVLPGDVAEVAGDVPSFAALLDLGRVGRGNPMLLGFDSSTGAAVDGSWLDLYSCAVGGLSGSGKSWTAAFLAGQAALWGTRFVVLDPHAANAESLASRLAPLRSRFVCDLAESPREMKEAVGLVVEELGRRKSGGRGEPWLFLVDEFSALQRGELAAPLGDLVEALGQEGRKLGLYAMVCGQVWTAARAGGSELRDSLASAYVHRLRPSQARYLTGLTAAELPGDLLHLPPGSAYLLNTAGDLRRVAIPRMGAGDLARVAELVGAPSAAPSAAPSGPRSMGFRPGAREVAREVGDASPLPGRQDGESWTAEEARIVALLAAGKSPGEVARDLAGGASGGRAYTEAARKVAQVVARLAARVGSAAH